MIKHIKLQKKYTLNVEGYQLKLPSNIETIIPEDDSVRLLSQFVETMDLTDLWLTIGPQTTDTTTLIPFLKDAENHLKFKYKNITADAGVRK